jgi:hypothetical protein
MPQAPYKPTKADRQTVKNLAILGLKEEEIAKCLGTQGISVPTMRKYYEYELYRYPKEMFGKIAQTAAQAAMSGDKTMMIFVLKCRAGWKESDSVQLNGKVELVKRVVGVDEKDI